jgi:hypothetical protein
MKKLAVHLLSASAVVLFEVAPAFARLAPNPPTSVPEPGTFALLGLGAVGFAVYKKFKK